MKTKPPSQTGERDKVRKKRPSARRAARKVVLITGGSRGIGEGCARVFVAAGYHVMICARHSSPGERLAAALTRKGPGKCHFSVCDVTRPDAVRELIEKTVSLHGRLDCLLNNAGFHPDHRPIDGFSVSEFEELLRLNIVSYFAACKFALPHLRKTHGSIVNIGSLVGNMGQEWASTYVATKGAISSLTKALAIDEMRHGVRVNTVLPGVIHVPASDVRTAEMQERIESWQWAGREGTAEEVGHACLFLAGEGAGFITGIDLIVSGGAELGYGIKKPEPTLTGSLK